MKSIIQSHNKNILKQDADENANDPMCNCRVIANCPLNGSCQVEQSIYQATVTCEDEPEYGEKFYIGLAEPKFKKRHANHKTSFANERYEKETELSKEVWRLKRKKPFTQDHVENNPSVPTFQSIVSEMFTLSHREIGNRFLSRSRKTTELSKRADFEMPPCQ